jgi:hypothetical protein
VAAPIRERPPINIEHATRGISGRIEHATRGISGREPSALGHGRFNVKFGCGVVARPRGSSTMLRLLLSRLDVSASPRHRRSHPLGRPLHTPPPRDTPPHWILIQPWAPD